MVVTRLILLGGLELDEESQAILVMRYPNLEEFVTVTKENRWVLSRLKPERDLIAGLAAAPKMKERLRNYFRKKFVAATLRFETNHLGEEILVEVAEVLESRSLIVYDGNHWSTEDTDAERLAC